MNSETPSSKPDLYVVARIIASLKEKNKVNKTTLSVSTGLAYDKLIRYLDWMSKKGWIVIDSNGSVVLTKEGLEVYYDLVQ
jgi:predicted transcriptional regulator